ncbi:MAG: recombinase family protein [Chloroflexi bacterium]|nr:recombinase family protein [Chloroflexota bacterium]
MRAIGYLSQAADHLHHRERDGAAGHVSDEPRPGLVEQNARFLAYCQEHGFEPTATFLDSDLSPQRERTGLRQLLRHLNEEARGFTFVIVQGFDHLGGDATQAVRTVLQLRARGVQLISLEEGPIDDSTLVDLWRLHNDPDPDAERRRRRLQEKARLGQAIGRPPYGYRIGDDGRYEIDGEEATVVRRIFDLYLHDGLGIRRVAQRLNADGYQTRRGRNWSMVTIRDLLRNPVYIGRYDKLGVSVPANHEAIVSEPDFQSVAQQMMQRRTAPGVSHPSDFLLSGLIWCGEDQSRMIGVTRRRQWRNPDGERGETVYRYYQSEARTNQSVGSYHTRQADELEAEVLAHIRGEREGGEPSVLNIGRNDGALAAETVVAVANAEARLRAIDRRLGQLLEDVASGDPPPAGLQDAGSDLIAEWETASADLAQIRFRAAAQDREAERRRRRDQRIHRVREQWDQLAFPQRRDLIEHLVERVVVFDHSVTTQLKA